MSDLYPDSRFLTDATKTDLVHIAYLTTGALCGKPVGHESRSTMLRVCIDCVEIVQDDFVRRVRAAS